MKYCKNCRTPYSGSDVCPKCGVSREEAEKAEIAEEKADRRRVGLDWLWLVIGVPAFIGLIYLFILLLNSVK